ncbi:GNAT family N-acetyltransferase [Nocardia jinanensis]|uniref:N-acetyltransferase n=1 Tax=Nocardia jinanensis TaxID=382504 RepID=A0A917RXV4_9NOCA|nr:GNAT family N-acetyltransferase [Nocardia jinanensis]GGL44908.1 N-acetyltransferase [Nocardia jinanensis]
MRLVLGTTRTILRPFEFADCTELHEIFGDPATHTIGDGPFTSPEQTRHWIHRRIDSRERSGLLWYAVRDSATGLLLGDCGLFAGRTGADEPEIGYEIRRSHQGRGFASEVARAVLQEAAACGVPRVWATIRPKNTASIRVAAKAGFTRHHLGGDDRGQLVYLVSPRFAGSARGRRAGAAPE